jgi:hypothetical protein
MYHCENYGGNEVRDESCDHSNWHNTLHFFPGSKYGGVLVGIFDKTWREPEH